MSKFRDGVSVPKCRTVCAIRGRKNELEPLATGRPRKFCSDVCRSAIRAYMAGLALRSSKARKAKQP